MGSNKQMACNPYRATNDLQQLHKLYQDFFGFPVTRTTTKEEWSPIVDIYETDNELVLQSELPGMTEADFKLSSENNVLTLVGERKFTDQEKYKVHHQERSQGSFERSFTVPATFDLGKVIASYKEGILSISVPKRVTARPRQIEVEVR
ncbi:MAG: Hsp20/alpha crystallin family protein [Acidobacteria bacterium]|nr:Hsp20/alpha crystallin family protein [Acidobacteriota bacterium]